MTMKSEVQFTSRMIKVLVDGIALGQRKQVRAAAEVLAKEFGVPTPKIATVSKVGSKI